MKLCKDINNNENYMEHLWFFEYLDHILIRKRGIEFHYYNGNLPMIFPFKGVWG